MQKLWVEFQFSPELLRWTFFAMEMLEVTSSKAQAEACNFIRRHSNSRKLLTQR
jgi:hypothetical protein